MIKIFAFSVACSILLVPLGCKQASAEWEKNKMPKPNESWSTFIIQSNPELGPNGKLGLERACEIALNYHPDIAKGRGLLEAADARVSQAISQYLPQLRIVSSYSTSNDSDDKNSYRAGLSGDQLVTDFGKTHGAHLQAYHSWLAAMHDLESTAASVLLEVRESFISYLSEKELLSVATESVSSFEKHLKEAEKFQEVGKRTKADVAKAQVDLALAKLELIKTKNRLEIARVRLNRALGLEQDTGYQIEYKVEKKKFDITIDEAIKQARVSRPELKSAWERFIAAEHALSKSYAEYLPGITFTSSYDYSGSRFPLTDRFSFGPSLIFNLFNGFLTPERIRESAANLRAVRADLASTEQKIYQEVQTALLNLKEANERIILADETIKSATESLSFISGRYKVGNGTILEQTDAELSLSKAKAEQIRSIYDYELGIVRILRAVGIAKMEDKAK